MNKITMVFISLLVLSGCTSAPYDGVGQNRSSGLDMNLIANTILASSLYNNSNNFGNHNNFNTGFGTNMYG
ncbi:MAG: hypothetical protein RR904_05850, partial [Bacilli bacterium]